MIDETDLSLSHLAWRLNHNPLETAPLDAEAESRLEELRSRSFGDTCLDYVVGVFRIGQQFGVVVFVEPAGAMIKLGISPLKVIDWWIRVFET